jgi:hypothetical protein
MRAFESIPLDQLTEADLDALVVAQAEESRTLDAKRDAYGTGDSDKKDLAKDLTSFANILGGDILVGVDEKRGRLTSIPGLSDDPDKLILRYQQIALSGITPRIPGIGWQPVKLKNGNFVLVIRIPRSGFSPHRVELNDYRYWFRAGSLKEKFDVDQLRRAFLAGPEYAQRARAWRMDRLQRIVANEAPVRVERTDTFCVHVLHRDVFGDTRLTMEALRGQAASLTAHSGFRRNLDGLAGHVTAQGATAASKYTQLGKDGSFEYVHAHVVGRIENTERGIYVDTIETQMRDAVIRAFAIAHALKLQGPFTVFASLTGVRGVQYISRVHGLDAEDTGAPGFDRDIVATSELVVDEIPPDDKEVARLLEPLRNEIANAAGWWKSPHS